MSIRREMLHMSGDEALGVAALTGAGAYMFGPVGVVGVAAIVAAKRVEEARGRRKAAAAQEATVPTKVEDSEAETV